MRQSQSLLWAAALLGPSVTYAFPPSYGPPGGDHPSFPAGSHPSWGAAAGGWPSAAWPSGAAAAPSVPAASGVAPSAVSSAAPSASASAVPFCLNDAEAKQIGDDFAVLISNYNATFANLVLAADYTDQSDSVNTLINSGGIAPIPLGNLTFASKAAFLAGQGSQPNVPFTILNRWHTCDTVLIRWVAFPGAQQVQGFDAIVVEPSANGFQPYQLKTVYGEFNSGAWLADLGRPECNATAAAAA